MAEVPRRQLVLYAAAALVVALIGMRYLRESGPPSRESSPRPVPVLTELPEPLTAIVPLLLAKMPWPVVVSMSRPPPVRLMVGPDPLE